MAPEAVKALVDAVNAGDKAELSVLFGPGSESLISSGDDVEDKAERDRDGDGVYAYAQKIASTPGKKDGLFWEAKEGEEASPLGPFAAKAAQEGYTRKEASGKPSPYYGYYFKILKAQGKHAPGGSYDYVVKGNMILGFGLVAYPATYGTSGIMTFLVNQEGVVYQKDLGKGTAKTAAGMKRYDPDPTWKKVEPVSPQGSPPGK